MAAHKILIVDDSRTFRHLEEELLKRRGYTLVQAENGAQAIQLATQESPDLILLDLQMPVMNGATALALLKSNEKTSAIPIVMITTLADDAQRQQLLKAGAARFLSKPLDGNELVETIRGLLDDKL